MYRIDQGTPDLSSVSGPLKPVIEALLRRQVSDRPGLDNVISQLNGTSSSNDVLAPARSVEGQAAAGPPPVDRTTVLPTSSSSEPEVTKKPKKRKVLLAVAGLLLVANGIVWPCTRVHPKASSLCATTVATTTTVKTSVATTSVAPTHNLSPSPGSTTTLPQTRLQVERERQWASGTSAKTRPLPTIPTEVSPTASCQSENSSATSNRTSDITGHLICTEVSQMNGRPIGQIRKRSDPNLDHTEGYP